MTEQWYNEVAPSVVDCRLEQAHRHTKKEEEDIGHKAPKAQITYLSKRTIGDVLTVYFSKKKSSFKIGYP